MSTQAVVHSRVYSIRTISGSPALIGTTIVSEHDFGPQVGAFRDSASTVRYLMEKFNSDEVKELFSWDLDLADPKHASPYISDGTNKFQISFKISRSAANSADVLVRFTKSKDSISPGKLVLSKKDIDVVFEELAMLELNKPVLIGAPYSNGAYFAVLEFRTDIDSEPAKESSSLALVSIKKVYPFYPRELYQQGIAGSVGIRLTIDTQGLVELARITKPLHPYLDNAALNAVRQWTFEPIIRQGRPVPISANIFVEFNQDTWQFQQEKAAVSAPSGGLDTTGIADISKVMEGIVAYWSKLRSAMPYFLCREELSVIHFNDALPQLSVQSTIYETRAMSGGGVLMVGGDTWHATSPSNTRLRLSADFRFASGNGTVREERVISGDKNRAASPAAMRDLKRFSALNPFLIMSKILSHDAQPRFWFRIVDLASYAHRNAYVLEAVPKTGNEDGVEHAKIWIATDGFGVLKAEIRGLPVGGFEDILGELTKFSLASNCITSYDFGREHEGVFLPTELACQISYPGIGEDLRARPRMVISEKMNNYRFFTVETESSIK